MLAASVAALAGLLPAATQGSTQSTISFSFRGYANNVRVEPPLVARFQLGTARIHGTGTLAPGGHFVSGVVDITDPLDARYPTSTMRAEVTGYRYFQAAHATSTKLTLNIEITSTNAAHCEQGDSGILTLYESGTKLSNGERSDYITMGHWGGKCPTFVQGWTNEDGGLRTSPHYGGPPHGGQWAIVSISL